MYKNWKKNAAFFLSGQAVSLLGSALVQYAITWHITLTMKSGMYTTIAVMAGFLPMLLMSPFAGVWADRYDRKKLIILADGGIALSTLALALIYMSGYQEIWLLFVVMAMRSFGGAVQSPCVNAMLPDIVPKENLDRVNGLNTSLQSLINLAAPMLSGALMGFVSLEIIFFIDVVTAAIAILIMLFLVHIKKEKAEAATDAPDYFKELKAGFSYIGQRKWLKNFFIFMTMLYVVIGPVTMLTPLQVARNYGDEVWRLSVMEVLFSVGMILGGLIFSVWSGFSNRVKTIGAGTLIMGVLALALGFAIPYPAYVAIMGIFGITMPFFNTPAIVILQEKADPAYLGRIFSIMGMISGSVTPLGMLLYGPLADQIPIEWLLLGTGACIVVISVLIARNKAMLAEGKKPAPTPAAAAAEE